MTGSPFVRSKACSKCGQERPLDEFQPNPRGKFGRKSTCRECNRAAVKEWRRVNPDRVRQNKRRSWDRHKDRLNRDRREKRGEHEREVARQWRLSDPERYRAKARTYRKKNKERVAEWNRRWYEADGLEWSRQWREENPERVRENNHRRRAAVRNPSPETTARIAALLTQPCAYCGSTESIEIDHVIPLSRGGKHEADNLTSACQPCNRSKHNKLIEEWLGEVV